MVTVIIASVDDKMLESVSKNIKETIGVPFEILAYKNSNGQRGICEIYNQGARDSKFEYLCYMHEDVNVRTKNWGDLILDIFKQNEQIGLIGIAGSVYKTLSISGWMDFSEKNERSNIIQHFKYRVQDPLHQYRNPNGERLATVACVDGVWFCTPRRTALAHEFDAGVFKDFHGYDVDYSLSVGQKYRNVVTYDVLIDHFSEGHFARDWLLEAIKLHSKWNRKLPVSISPLSKKDILSIEKKTFHYYYEIAKIEGVKKEFLAASLWSLNGFLRLNPVLFFKILFFIVKHP